MSPKNYFKNKKITLMGLGLLGRGVGDALFLAEYGARLTITDLKTKKQLAPSLKKFSKYKGIKFVLGKHDPKDFQKADMILKSAGVSLNSPFIAEAKKNKVPIEMSASLFMKLSGIPIVGITGTRGKTTVTMLIYEILKEASKKQLGLNRSAKIGTVGRTGLRCRPVLGGNIQGVSNLQLLKKTKGIDFAVLELDSWQLQGFGESKISPYISVFTTFYPDHMNYYKNDMNAYFRDKAFIFQNQTKTDFFFAGEQTKKWVRKEKKNIKANFRYVSKKDFPSSWKTSLPGEHNRENIALAVAIAQTVGVKNSVIKKVVENFKGVSGRLELIRSLRGIKIYNDTTSTTPEATIMALRALGKKQNVNLQGSTFGNYKVEPCRIILIMGGADKGLDMSPLIKEISRYCKEVIFLSGSGTEKLKAHSLKLKALPEYESLKSAAQKALQIAKKGDIILFSPAFASFGMFKNEYDRGEQFVKLVKKLK